MDLRSASFEIAQKEFRPFFEMAIANHPTTIDIKVKRGNPVTARDYARRILIRANKEGYGSFSAEHIRSLSPRLRIYYCDGGIAIAAIKRRHYVTSRGDDYKFPFELYHKDDGRWVTMAIDPSAEDIRMMGVLLLKGVLFNPIEIKSKFTMAEISKILKNTKEVKIFKHGRNIVLWPVK